MLALLFLQKLAELFCEAGKLDCVNIDLHKIEIALDIPKATSVDEWPTSKEQPTSAPVKAETNTEGLQDEGDKRQMIAIAGPECRVQIGKRRKNIYYQQIKLDDTCHKKFNISKVLAKFC